MRNCRMCNVPLPLELLLLVSVRAVYQALCMLAYTLLVVIVSHYLHCTSQPAVHIHRDVVRVVNNE
jgi:hypothetical protein